MATAAAAAAGAIVGMQYRQQSHFPQSKRSEPSNKDKFLQAVHQNDVRAVNQLLRAGVSLSDFCSSPHVADDLPLNVAVIKGHHTMVKRLLVAGAEVDKRDWMGESPIHSASRNGDRAMVDTLLSAGAKVDYPTADGVTALMLAAQSGNSDLVQQLITQGADSLAVDKKGNGVLHWAAKTTKNTAMLTHLMDQGFSPNASNKYGETPVHTACYHAGLPELRLLAQRGGAPAAITNSGANALHYALNAETRDYPAKLDFLLTQHVDVNQSDLKGLTPLQIASQQGEVGMVATLLAAGADPKKPDQTGKTPLHMTLKPRIAELLLAAGADLNTPDSKGNTPLISTLKEIYNLLIVNQFRSRLQRDAGVDVATRLLESGADVNVKSQGYTPLYYAIVYGSSLLIQNLLDRGARMTDLTPQGHDAYQVAKYAEKGYGMTEEKTSRLLDSYKPMRAVETLRRTYIIGHRQSRDTVVALQSLFASDKSDVEKDTEGLKVLGQYQKLKCDHHLDSNEIDVKFWALRRFAISQGNAAFGQWTTALIDVFRNQNFAANN